MVEKICRKETNDQKKRPTKKRKISSAKKILFDSSESECNEEIKYENNGFVIFVLSHMKTARLEKCGSSANVVVAKGVG